jgi:hypothetical protein
VDWYLVIRCYQVDCGENPAPSQLMSKVGDVPDMVLVFDGTGIQRAVVSMGCPAILFLGDELEGRSPEAA